MTGEMPPPVNPLERVNTRSRSSSESRSVAKKTRRNEEENSIEDEDLIQTIEKQNERIENLEKIIERLLERVDILEAKKESFSDITETKKLFSNLFENNGTKKGNKETPCELRTNILNAVRIEQKEIESRDSNLIVLGVEMSSSIEDKDKLVDDENKMKEIFRNLSLDPDQIKKIYRFEKKGDSERPSAIKVTLKIKNYRLTVLKASKGLKKLELFKNIYINKDLTFSEREAEKKLISKRNEMNEELKGKEVKVNYYCGIRNGVIVEIPIRVENGMNQ
jgi:hypothetical protein